MTDENLRQLRVLHVVSSRGVPAGLQASLFMPLLTRMPKQRVKTQVAALAPGVVHASVLRQNGVPVHDVALSRERFSFGGFGQLASLANAFRPDVIQAWGHTAQLAALAVARRCDWDPEVVWSVAPTAPLERDAGLIDRQKLKLAARYARSAARIVYTSEAGASQHRRAGFPEDDYIVAAPGVDATRFKPDVAARRKLRSELKLGGDAFVVGMVAPFQAEYDHATFLKGIGDLVKTNPNVSVLLAGHGIQRGNAPLMAMVGGGTMGTRTQLLGEWSDLSSLFNACDVACSTALTDNGRTSLVMAMLCGVPCVATGMGAQGEVLGQFGVAIEPGSPTAIVRGISRIMQLSPEKRAFMAQGARKHALQNFVYVRSLQKYLQLYYDLIGRQSLVTDDVPTPQIDPSVPVAQPLPKEESTLAAQQAAKSAFDMADPDSLETVPVQVAATAATSNASAPPVEVASAPPAAPVPKGPEPDILSVLEFDTGETTDAGKAPADMNRARGVAEEVEDLLAPEALVATEPVTLRAPSPADKEKLASAVTPPRHEPSKEKSAPLRSPNDKALAGRMIAPKSSPAPADPPLHAAISATHANAPGELQLELLGDAHEPPKLAVSN